MRKYFTLTVLAACALSVVCLAPLGALADSLRYIDESGNIHFVDRLTDIPEQYRSQVVPARPTPASQQEYRQQLAEWKRQRKEEEREAKRQEREREREEKKKKRELEKAEKKQRQLAKSGKGKKVTAAATPKPKAVPSSSEPASAEQGAGK